MTGLSVVTFTCVDPMFETVFGPVFEDQALCGYIKSDAEHVMSRTRQTSDPDKRWWVVVSPAGEALAWCAAWAMNSDPRTIMCGENYERRGLGRELAVYPLAFAARQEWLIKQPITNAVTYIFRQPIELHEAAGWCKTGATATSHHEHQWWELVWANPLTLHG